MKTDQDVQAHEHCWHAESSTTDGMGQKGWDSEICCRCGVKARHFWEMERDPNHGAYAEAKRQSYGARHIYSAQETP